MAFLLRQKKCKKTHYSPIDLTKISFETSSTPNSLYWVEQLTLQEKEMLLGGDWLNDNLINASQCLIKSQYPHISGLQDVILGPTLAFSICPDEFIQILNTGHGHWVTVSTIGCTKGEILIYDSLPPAMTPKLRNQIACLLCTSESVINAKYIDVQMQDGSADCGLFAVAFAATLASGGQPGGSSYCQANMRPHLANCLEKNALTPFPVKRKRRNACKVKSTITIPVYCTCRLPTLKDCTMIQCSKCCGWYHVDVCVNVPQEVLGSSKKWFCSACI